MLKMTITPFESTYLLPIPANYVGKTVDVLLHPSVDVFENKTSNNKKPSDFFCISNADDGNEFQNYVTNSRLEWNRDI
jgi:hypothetical protein